MKEEKKPKVEISYELKMYHLLILFLVSIFISIGIGVWAGNNIGYHKGVDAVNIETPEYCYAENQGLENVKVVCTELENVTVADLCETLSTPLEHKVKILIAG